MTTKLVIVRGPSGSGKTTIVKELQRRSAREIVIVEQDYFRHSFLNDREDAKAIVPELVYQNTIVALRAGYDVIVEGIFRKQKYSPAFERLFKEHAGENYVVYFDVPIEETVRRHQVRIKAVLFGDKQLQKWYHMAEPLGYDSEYIIPAAWTVEETVSKLRKRLGI